MTTLGPSTAADPAEDIMHFGYARIALPPALEALLTEAKGAARDFFALDLVEKQRHSSPDLNFGFRPMGTEYAQTAERPDLNDAFTLWADRLDLIPNAGEIASLTNTLSALSWGLLATVEGVLKGVARSTAADDPAIPRVQRASHLQINQYSSVETGRLFLQDLHEDGHLLTLLHAQERGLELIIKDKVIPIVTKQNEMLVMPGSTLTLMTGGQISPLYHQVRNLQLPYRLSTMFFVNPELSHPLIPWTGEDKTDIREVVRTHPQQFGLPVVPTL